MGNSTVRLITVADDPAFIGRGRPDQRGGVRSVDVRTRFAGHVNRSNDSAKCWEWTGYVARNGYGYFGFLDRDGKAVNIPAHRASYALAFGPIRDGLTIDHVCRNRRCVNTHHLEAVTNKENLMRGETKAAANAAKTHCPQGHPYSGENLYVSKRGDRMCRECMRVRCRDNQRARRRAA